MKNEMSLDEYGVQNLSIEEQKETEGGILPAILVAAGALCGAIAWDIVFNFDSAVAAVNRGYNQTRHH